MDLLRIGIVGAQFSAHLHLQNYKPLRGSKVEITGIASRTRPRAEEFARKYLSNAVVQVNINPSDTVVAYAPAPQIFGEEYIAEKLETKAGWNFASPDEDWVRGYPQELEDFVDCLLTGREPVSGLELALETVEAIYAAYLAAEKGRRVELAKQVEKRKEGQ